MGNGEVQLETVGEPNLKVVQTQGKYKLYIINGTGWTQKSLNLKLFEVWSSNDN